MGDITITVICIIYHRKIHFVNVKKKTIFKLTCIDLVNFLLIYDITY